MPLPWVPAMVRAYLVQAPAFLPALSAVSIGLDRVVFEQPPDVTRPFVLIRDVTSIPMDPSGMSASPLWQVEGFAPATLANAKETAWNLAALAGQIMGRARNVAFANVSYSGRWTDGPLPLDDVSRGDATVLRRRAVRGELRVHIL